MNHKRVLAKTFWKIIRINKKIFRGSIMNKLNEEYGSLKVVCPYDCGNAPKKKLLQELTIAIAKNDQSFILEHLKDDVCWDIVGNKQIKAIIMLLKYCQKRRKTEQQSYILITLLRMGVLVLLMAL